MQSSTHSISCLSCGSKHIKFWANARDLEYFTSQDTFSYYLCHKCGVLFIDPVPRDHLSKIYPPNYYSFTPNKKSWIHRIKNLMDRKAFQKILRNLPGDSLNILDVGGGEGWHLSLLKDLDLRIRITQLVDIDPDASDLAQSQGHQYFCGRIEDFNTCEKFDLVLLLNLIEHVESPQHVLAKIRSLLSPQGVILVQTPNYDSWDAQLFRHLNWGGYHCPRHWVLFTKNSFKRIIEQVGLKIRRADYIQGASFWASSILFLLAKYRLISITAKKPAIYHPLTSPLMAIFALFDMVRVPFSKTSQMFFIIGHGVETANGQKTKLRENQSS